MKLDADKDLLMSCESVKDLMTSLIKKHNLSLREFSRILDFPNPSLLSDIVNKKRKPSLKVVESLIQKMQCNYSTQQFIWNLYKIETSSAIENFEKENQLIKQYWDVSTDTTTDIGSIELILKTLVGSFNGGLTYSELQNKTGSFISKTELHIALDKLEKFKIIEPNASNRYTTVPNLRHFLNASPKAMADIHKVIERLLEKEPRGPFVSSMHALVSQEAVNEINQTLKESLEKVALILSKDENDIDLNKAKKLYGLYLHSFTTDI